MKQKTSERGFTLLELVVGLSIAAFVVGAASMTTITMMRLTPKNNDWAVALHQVQNASHWISHDVQMAQGDITVGTWPGTTYLTLRVPEWETDTVVDKTVIYEFEDMTGGLKRLIRNHQTEGETMIAENISNAEANFYSDNATLTFTIEATAGDVEVSRDYEAMQRVPTPATP
jgi:prepilin-type N-terminal cleavage/methylation domain-containing protein